GRAVRAVETQVKALAALEVEQLFAALRERVLRHGTFSDEPPGFGGLMIVAKHHPTYQTQLLGLVAGIDARALGFWVVKGWTEILSSPSTKEELRALLSKWASQDENKALKRAAVSALAAS